MVRSRLRFCHHNPMPKVDHLTKLLEAVADQNWTVARASAVRIADAEEEKGHHAAAERLRGALQPNGHRYRGVPSEAAAPSNGQHTWLAAPGFLTSALTISAGKQALDDVQLTPKLRKELEGVLTEWKHREALEENALTRRRKLLFHGPPGCGKSLTAAALGNDLCVPTYVVRVDAVVGAYLGQTALRIRELFRFAEETDCVLLLDEIDALGKQRGSQQDIGELDRVVISLMQELEHSTPKGFVIATSNLPQHLDEALFRRFDAVLEFPRPTPIELARFGRNRASAGKLLPPTMGARLANRAVSFAEAARRIEGEERSTVLQKILG